MGILDGFYTDWQTIAYAAAGISVLAAAMLIIVSRMFNLKTLEQVAKTEFVFAVSTVFIVLMTIGILGVGEDLMVALTRCVYLKTFGVENCYDPAVSGVIPNVRPGVPATTLIDYMKLYMTTPVTCAKDILNFLYPVSIVVESIASVYIEVFMSEPVSGYGIKAIAERIKNITQMLSFYIWIYYVLVHALNFIKYYAGFFFSIGVAMRAFPPTRGAGAYMMAAAVGFYFVLPFAYILVASIALPQAQGAMVTPLGADEAFGEEGLSALYVCNMPAAPPDVTSLECGSAGIRKLFIAADIFESRRDELFDIFHPETGQIVQVLKNLIASLCLAPLIAMIITMTFILNTTNLFGGNIPEIGRGLVKLI